MRTRFVIKGLQKPPRKVCKFNVGDYDNLRLDIASFATSFLKSSKKSRTVDQNWSIMCDKLQSLIDKHIPHVIAKGKHHLPWLKKKAKCSRKPQHWSAYKKVRNEVQSLIKKSHNTYVNNIISGIKPDGSNSSFSTTKAWTYLKSLWSESTVVPPLVHNNKICTSDSSKAEALCEQFTEEVLSSNLSATSS